MSLGPWFVHPLQIANGHLWLFIYLNAVTPLVDDVSPLNGRTASHSNFLHLPKTTQEDQVSMTSVEIKVHQGDSDSESDDEADLQNVLHEMRRFRQKQRGFIDVWWLFDDGGWSLRGALWFPWQLT